VDFNNSGIKIQLASENKQKIIQQIRVDSEFLASKEINDYSLLLGIHYLKNDVLITEDENSSDL
jgi:Phosphatidylinositol-4-phosphate 5-kinase